MLSGATLLASCQMTADTSTQSVIGVSAVDNPALARQCGLEAVLVLDASASVRNYNNPPDGNGAIDLVAGAANAFLNAFENTGTRVSVVSYNATPIAHLGLVDVTTQSLGTGGAHAVAIGNPGGPTGPVPVTTGFSQHARAGSGTNWEAGLLRARSMLDSARTGVPRLVVHVSDGRPTRHLDPEGRPSDVGGMAQHVAEAAEEADRLKAAGVHVYSVGIGRAPEYVPALQATSGPDVYDQSDANDVFDPANDDVILASNFESLEEVLRDVAGELCGASLTITKIASTPAAPDDYAASSGWPFTARPSASGGFDWLLPDDDLTAEKTALTDGNGRVAFQWDVFDEETWGNGVVSITETQRGGFAIQSQAVCMRTNSFASEPFSASVNVSTGSFDVEIHPGDTVTCVVRNRAGGGGDTPAPGAIEVVKTASVGELPEPGGDVTFTFEVRETSGAAAVTIDTLSDSVYGDLNGQGDCAAPQFIPAGGSYTCSITASVTGNAGFTHVNVVTASGADEHGNPVSGSDDATVVIGDLPPDPGMCKAILPGTVPPTGGYINLAVYIFNDSQHPDPISILSLTDDRFGDLLDPANPLVIDGYCRSRIDPGGSYGCIYSVFLPGGAPGEVHRESVTLQVADDEGNLVSASYETSVEVTAGQGVSPADYWADQSGASELDELLVGDWDGDGSCNHRWERCISLTSGQVAQILAATDAGDRRLSLAREVVASWLNIRTAGNDFLCTESAVNQGVAWLHQRAPGGNPLAGGEAVDEAAWVASNGPALAGALTGYNTTGAGCALPRN
jgi:Mg-chelatase subunit ChlD